MKLWVHHDHPSFQDLFFIAEHILHGDVQNIDGWGFFFFFGRRQEFYSFIEELYMAKS